MATSTDRAGASFQVPGPLPRDEYERIFSRVPRLTVEVVIAAEDRGVLLALRESGPCRGLWHLPGGTVRFGEPLVQAVARVARSELGLQVTAGAMLGYIEYPSHYNHGLDSPVGVAFRSHPEREMPGVAALRSHCSWFRVLPANIHDEQRTFLTAHLEFVTD